VCQKIENQNLSVCIIQEDVYWCEKGEYGLKKVKLQASKVFGIQKDPLRNYAESAVVPYGTKEDKNPILSQKETLTESIDRFANVLSWKRTHIFRFIQGKSRNPIVDIYTGSNI
jgi:hypothetical protein